MQNFRNPIKTCSYSNESANSRHSILHIVMSIRSAYAGNPNRPGPSGTGARPDPGLAPLRAGHGFGYYGTRPASRLQAGIEFPKWD